MLNLLPTEEKKNVRSEYRCRLLSVGLMFSLVVFIISTVLLFPSLVKINFNINQAEKSLEVLNGKAVLGGYQDLENIVKQTKLEIDFLDKAISNQTHVADKIIRVLKNKPAGIKVENITWLSSNNSKGLILGGKSSSRDILNQYYNALNSDNFFAKVALPISDLAKSSGGQFSITINFN